MDRPKWIGSVVIAWCALITACSGGSNPNSPSNVPGGLNVATGVGFAPMQATTGSRSIQILDQCDPDTFNAAIGPGTCVDRNGGLPFDAFIAALQKHMTVPSWRFSPDTIHVPDDMTLPINNRGGEAHTFTEVAAFGGGVVPVLNALSGTPVPAPECLALSGSDFIPPGGQTSHTFEPGESDKYQCCIHPWMRATTR